MVTGCEIGGGLRTYSEQAKLHQQKPRLAASPGHSWHEVKIYIDGVYSMPGAVDLEFPTTKSKILAHKLAEEYKFYFPLSYEPWHMQPIETKGKSVPSSGTLYISSGKRISSISTSPVTSVITNVGGNYWKDDVNLNALVWIANKESKLKVGAVSKSGKYKGLFQLGSPPRWMVLGDATSETKAGCEYIKTRYKTPLKAKLFWINNSWY